jgi:nucleoside-diphosphate-sugar epimerase
MGAERPRVAVTGAAGFIGRALVAHLRAAGYPCRALVRNPPRNPMGEVVVSGTLGPQSELQGMLRDIDVLVHAAWRLPQRRSPSPQIPAQYCQASSETLANLARQAARAGVKRLIFLSSIKVHGESSRPGKPFRPGDIPAPADIYARAKYMAEQALREAAAEIGLEIVVIRPPLVYGPRVKGNFRAMMVWLMRGVPLPFGAVDNRRSLVALPNLIDFLTICIAHPAAPSTVLLPADGAAVSTPHLLALLGRALGCPARLPRIPMPVLKLGGLALGRRGSFDRLCGSLEIDVAPARAQLDWMPPVDMESAVVATAAAFLSERANKR